MFCLSHETTARFYIKPPALEVYFVTCWVLLCIFFLSIHFTFASSIFCASVWSSPEKAAIAHLTFHEVDSRSWNVSFINIESVILFFFITRSRALFQVKNFHNNYSGERWQAVSFFPSLENKEIIGTVYSKVTVCFSSLVNNFYRRFYRFSQCFTGRIDPVIWFFPEQRINTS